jgi:hypothetical protein
MEENNNLWGLADVKVAGDLSDVKAFGDGDE